jgi:AraC-like DNA-binding protein
MVARFEKVPLVDGSFHAYERFDREFAFNWHYHPEFELTLVTDSNGQRMVGDSICDYRPGDLVLLGPNLPHSYRSWSGNSRGVRRHRAIVIQFRQECFGDRFFELPEMKPVLHMFHRSAVGLAFGETETGQRAVARLKKLPSLSSGERMISLLSVLLELAAESGASAISTQTLLPLRHVEDERRIDRICSYLHEHFDESMDFADLARTVHLSQEALCRFFRRATGRTMTTYVNQLRVGAAAQLLMNTDLSVLEIGFQVGFGNYSNFNRQFKSIKGVTPLAVRREFRSNAHPPVTT